MPAIIDLGKCNGCGNCSYFCPGDIIHMEGNTPVNKYPEECWHCGICARFCAQDAICYEFPENFILRERQRVPEEAHSPVD